MTAQGTVKNGMVVLEAGAALPEGAHVVVTTVDQPTPQPSGPGNGPKAGSARGKVRMSADFDQPLPDFAEYMK